MPGLPDLSGAETVRNFQQALCAASSALRASLSLNFAPLCRPTDGIEHWRDTLAAVRRQSCRLAPKSPPPNH